jgi:hypothetical protein
VLNPSDQLFHSCINGIRRAPLPKITWIADAVTLLQSGAEIDWPRVVEHARKFQQTLVLQAALDYLNSEFQVPVPAVAFRMLAAHKPSLLDRCLYAQKTGRYRLSPLLMPVIWRENYVSRLGPIRGLAGLRDFVEFTREVWAIKSNREYAGFLVRKSREIVRRALGLRARGAKQKNTTTQFMRSGR